MNTKLVANIDKYYGYARKVCKNNYKDLLHHCLEKIPDDVQQIDRYVFLTLKNEAYNPRSSYNKLYNPKEYDEQVKTEPTDGYDINILYKILLELEIEGHEKKVDIFKRCYIFDNFTNTTKKTELSYYKLRLICDFIQEQIKIRYVKYDTDRYV